jgi:hypothetical protein
VSNALYAVLADLKAGVRLPSEPIALREFPSPSSEPRVGVARVGEIVAANIAFATAHLVSGAWRHGTRYYRSPDAFLCAYSELADEFEELMAGIGAIEALRDAIALRRREANAGDPIDIAMRAIAAANAGLDPTPEQLQLVESQRTGGSWPGFGALYSFGSAKAPPVYFGSPVVTAAFSARALSPRPAPLHAAEPGWARTLLDTCVAQARRARR